MNELPSAEKDDELVAAILVDLLPSRSEGPSVGATPSSRPDMTEKLELARSRTAAMVPPIPEPYQMVITCVWLTFLNVAFTRAEERIKRAMEEIVDQLMALPPDAEAVRKQVLTGLWTTSPPEISKIFEKCLLARSSNGEQYLAVVRRDGAQPDINGLSIIRDHGESMASRDPLRGGRHFLRKLRIPGFFATACLALVAVFVVRSSQLPMDSVIVSPEAIISSNGSNPAVKSAHRGFVLRTGESYIFNTTHSHPLKYQWLIHIDGNVQVAACGLTASPLKYSWTETEYHSDFDCFIVVTSDTLTDNFTKDCSPPDEGQKPLFTTEEIRALIFAQDDVSDNSPADDILLARVRSILAKDFGASPFRVEFCRVAHAD